MGTEKVIIFGSRDCGDWHFLDTVRGTCSEVICADGGVKLARAAGFQPTAYVGDNVSGGIPPVGIPQVLLPQVKNVTDLEQALYYAVQRGGRKILMTGCTGGRQDHHLANLLLLEQAWQWGAEAEIWDATNRISLLTPGTWEIDCVGYHYFGLIPLDRQVTGVCIENAKYPLTDYTLHRGSTRSVSNEPLDGFVRITVGSGNALLIRTKE